MGSTKRSTSSSSNDPLLDELVAEDHKIEEHQDSAILTLMEHRWKAVKHHGYSIRTYAKALGRGRETVRVYVRGWDMWQEPDRSGSVTPADILVLAGMGEHQAEAAAIVAEANNIGIASVGKSPRHRGHLRIVRNQIDEEAERLGSREEARTLVASRVNWRDGHDTVADLMDEDDPFIPGEHWSDKFIISLGKTSRELEGRVKVAGGVILGGITYEKALKYLTDTERRVADARAAVQEIINEGNL